MDIWAWVDKLAEELEKSGQDRVASLFYRIPDLRSDNEIAQVEALLPEALAAAKVMENPWVEIFFRHQEMRLRLSQKGEGEKALPEAVALLEFAHREDCTGCPQAVCTMQDISSCYANMDGPGWAEERKAVSLEGLGKIDPSWGCFRCLGHEYADALKDQGKLSESLTYFDNILKQLKAHGVEEDASDTQFRADLLSRMGRHEEALAELDRADKMEENTWRAQLRVDSKLLRARILAEMGRHGEAWDMLPVWSEIIPGDYRAWLEVVILVAEAKQEYNSWNLGGVFQQALEYMSQVGAHRDIIDLGAKAVTLAIARGSVSSPRRALNIMKHHLPKLRAPFGADKQIEELEKAASKVPPPTLPVSAEKLTAYISENDHSNAEEGLDWLFTALEERPDDLDLVLMTCSALWAMRAGEEVRELLWNYIRTYPEKSEHAVDNMIRYTPVEDAENLERLADYIGNYLPHMSDWCRLYIAYRNNSLEDVAKYASSFLKQKPDSTGSRMIWANTAMTNKDFGEALRLRRELVEMAVADEEGDPNSFRWDLLVAATCVGDWKLVRDTCIDMGFDIEAGDAPIDEPGQYVRIRYQEDGDWRTAFAERTGPVTARILSCSWPKQVQRLKDVVVFDPECLEPEPEDDEAKKDFIPPFLLVHTLEKGNCVSWLVDGWFPGDEEWKRFSQVLEDMDFVVDVRSADDYNIVDPAADPQESPAEAPEEGEGESRLPPPGRLPGIYFLLGVPVGFSPMELDAMLSRETKNWDHPLCWLGLAEAAGRGVERHQGILEKYGL